MYVTYDSCKSDGRALTGGSLQNPLLLRGVREGLEAHGISVYINERVPMNDCGVSLGQAYIAREVMRRNDA